MSEEDQNAAAEVVFAHLANRDRRHGLSVGHVEEVKRIRTRLRSGETRLATEKEVSEPWKKCGV